MENLLENGPLLGLAGLFGLHVCSHTAFRKECSHTCVDSCSDQSVASPTGLTSSGQPTL